MKIKNLTVVEDGGVMSLSFSYLTGADVKASKSLFDELAKLATKVDADGWHDINPNYDVSFDGSSDKIMVREKNVSKGHYGTPVVLRAFPATLLELGHITHEQMTEMLSDIDHSEPARERESHAVTPDYMRMGGGRG